MAKYSFPLDEARKRLYRAQGFWGDATLLDYWDMSVTSFPDKTAVADLQNTRYTFRELDGLAARLAHYLLRCGVEPGDVVSVQVPNWSEFTVIYIACLKAGAVINPLMPKFREAEILYRMGKCRSKVLFLPSIFLGYDYDGLARTALEQLPELKKVVMVDKEIRPASSGFDHLCDILAAEPPLAAPVRADADDVAIVLFTSGTESVGKGVMLTHNNMCANQKGYLALTQLNCTDSMLMPVPVAHATGFMYGVTVPFMTGMTSVLLEKFDAVKSLELIARERCTAIEGPTVIAYDIVHLLGEGTPYDISSLRYFFCGGAPIPRMLVEQANGMGIRILGVYGSTESAPHCIVSPGHPPEKVLTTDGTPVPGVEIRVVGPDGRDVPRWKEGEELSRGPNLFVGYLDEPEMTRSAIDENGWFHSGDLCIMDDDGYIRITGRKKDVIIRGGENISSVEVEGALMLHPNIAEAAVVAYPDQRLGEKACAYVVLRDPDLPLTLDDIRAHMAGRGIAKYKWPERLELVGRIPKTESGKPQKFRLREDIKCRMGLKKPYQVTG